MKNGSRVAFLAIFALASFIAAKAQTPQVSTVEISTMGFITDTLSGRTGATALHATASRRNVAAGMAKYAVYDEKTKQLYILEPQDTAAAYLELGQRVTVTGTLAASPMSRAGQMVDPRSNEVKDFHRPVKDSTPVAGVLTVTSIALAPPPVPPGAPKTQ
jgi:hypothetical protein